MTLDSKLQIVYAGQLTRSCGGSSTPHGSRVGSSCLLLLPLLRPPQRPSLPAAQDINDATALHQVNALTSRPSGPSHLHGASDSHLVIGSDLLVTGLLLHRCCCMELTLAEAFAQSRAAAAAPGSQMFFDWILGHRDVRMSRKQTTLTMLRSPHGPQLGGR